MGQFSFNGKMIQFESNHINNRLNLNDVETPIKIQRSSDWTKSNNHLYAAFEKQISNT